MFHITTFNADGRAWDIVQREVPGLLLLQQTVEGHIELVPYWEKYRGRRCVAYVNDVGKLRGLPINADATLAWFKSIGGAVDDYLVGNVIVVGVDSDAEFSEL